MPRKHLMTDEGTEIYEPDSYSPAQELDAKLPIIPEIQKPLFEIKLWRNTTEVYKCAQCDSFRNKDEKDEFILHILTHYADDEEKDAVLDRLLKELN